MGAKMGHLPPYWTALGHQVNTMERLKREIRHDKNIKNLLTLKFYFPKFLEIQLMKELLWFEEIIGFGCKIITLRSYMNASCGKSDYIEALIESKE